MASVQLEIERLTTVDITDIVQANQKDEAATEKTSTQKKTKLVSLSIDKAVYHTFKMDLREADKLRLQMIIYL